MISPIEISKASFSKSLIRGYSIEEVDAFLHSLAGQWDTLLQENQQLKLEIEKLKSALKSYQEVENMMHKTLQQAEETSSKTLENARRDAEVIIKQAENKANEILQSAQNDKTLIEQQVVELNYRKKDLLAQLKVFLSAQLDKLKELEQIEPVVPVSNASSVHEVPKTPSFFQQFVEQIKINPFASQIATDL